MLAATEAVLALDCSAAAAAAVVRADRVWTFWVVWALIADNSVAEDETVWIPPARLRSKPRRLPLML